MTYKQPLSRSLCSPLFYLLLCILQTTGAVRFDCFVCSYTRSSDPNVDYDCVDKGNTSTIGACQSPYMCKTLALFNKDMTHVRSATRNCLPQTDNCAGDKCCNMDGQYPLCEQKCRGDRCNDYSAAAWLKRGNGGISGTDNDSNTGTSVKRTTLWLVLTLSSTFMMVLS